MKRIILIAGLGLTLQACARVGDTAPSYLGMPAIAEASEDDDSVTPAAAPNDVSSLRHVTSNKVLGAMAFQKVTGRPVDPSRLQSGR